MGGERRPRRGRKEREELRGRRPKKERERARRWRGEGE
jgi:hypothetical protein